MYNFFTHLTQCVAYRFPKKNPPFAVSEPAGFRGAKERPQWRKKKKKREYQPRFWLPSKSRDLPLLYTLIVNKTITPGEKFKLDGNGLNPILMPFKLTAKRRHGLITYAAMSQRVTATASAACSIPVGAQRLEP